MFQVAHFTNPKTLSLPMTGQVPQCMFLSSSSSSQSLKLYPPINPKAESFRPKNIVGASEIHETRNLGDPTHNSQPQCSASHHPPYKLFSFSLL